VPILSTMSSTRACTSLAGDMGASASDPYEVLGVRPDASDDELRAAYRHLVQLHHPDHNGGSPESAKRFAVIQVAYTTVLEMRRAGHPEPPPPPKSDPGLEARLADMERELAAARAAQAKAVNDARAAARAAASGESAASGNQPRRPTPEELGYITTTDSLSKIFDDAETELLGRVSEARRSPFAKRLADLFGGSDES
jgi:DnaJ domain